MVWTGQKPRNARPPDSLPNSVGLAWLMAGLLCASVAAATDESTLPPPAAPSHPLLAETGVLPGAGDRFDWHLQATYVEQQSDRFRSPYQGVNSLPSAQGRETLDFTLYVGARLWQGAELWLDPELDQGFGLGNTTGLAGFGSGEAYKVGSAHPYLRWQRAFLRQTWNLGGAQSPVEPAANQFAASLTEDRIVLWLGKFSVGDLFDANRYAHDPRADFLNWSVIDTGSFDYAADAWGYTFGAAAEWYHGPWTLRTGVFDASTVPNSPLLERGTDEFQLIAEFERRYGIGERGGKIALTSFMTHARMALLGDALRSGNSAGMPPDPALVRSPRERYGVALNLEQELSASVDAFLRAGRSGGNVETYDFTDIDRTIAAGLALDGKAWDRPHDSIGLAGVRNQASALRLRYLAAGGLGVLTGDGRLPHAGAERLVEAYYRITLVKGLDLTVDYQYVANPAYNRDRGPVSLGAVRLHLQY